MGQGSICEVNIKPNLPPSVRIKSAAASDSESLDITLDARTTEYQSGFIYRRGMEVSSEIPYPIRGYGVLLDRPILVIKVCLPKESAWLMCDWDEDAGRADQVILALGSDDTDSLLASRIKAAAENALTIYRTFFR